MAIMGHVHGGEFELGEKNVVFRMNEKATYKVNDPVVAYFIARQRSCSQDVLDALSSQAAEKYRPLVLRIATSVYKTLPKDTNRTYVIPYAWVGFFDSLSKYDPTKSLKFTSYAKPRINGSIIDGMRKETTVHNRNGVKNNRIRDVLLFPTTRSLEDIVDSDGEELTRLGDVLADTTISQPDYEIEKESTNKALLKTLDKLPENNKRVLQLYFWEDMTLKDIGVLMNLSESSISKKLKKGLETLRVELGYETSPQPNKEYSIDLRTASSDLGYSSPTVIYELVKKLRIDTKKKGKHSYITETDFERMRNYKSAHPQRGGKRSSKATSQKAA